jgi:hypothetical protein
MVGASIEWLVDHLTPIHVSGGSAAPEAPAAPESQVESGTAE